MAALPVEEQIKRHLHPLDSFARLMAVIGAFLATRVAPSLAIKVILLICCFGHAGDG